MSLERVVKHVVEHARTAAVAALGAAADHDLEAATATLIKRDCVAPSQSRTVRRGIDVCASSRLGARIRGDLAEQLALAGAAVVVERVDDRLAPGGVAAELVIRVIEQQVRAQRRAFRAAADRGHRLDHVHEVRRRGRRRIEMTAERGERGASTAA